MRMTRSWVLGVALVALSVQGVRADSVEIVGDRVNLRAKPTLKAEVVGQASRGERMELLDAEGDWVGVAVPDRLSLWVFAEFVREGVVVPDTLNIRAGPGINYNVVASMDRGEAVTVRGRTGDWLEIAPPAGSTLWISREYVAERPAPARPVARVEPVAEPPAAPVQQAAEPPAVPAAPAVAPSPAPAAEPAPPVVIRDAAPVPPAGQGRMVEREGVLQKTSLLDFRRQSEFALMERSRGRPVTICYVRGNRDQLKSFLNRRLRIRGEAYWVSGTPQPVIVPRQIVPMADPVTL